MWSVGVLLGLVVLGPALQPGSMLNLDLLVTPDIPIPNGMFGLGPALSQRVPSFAVLGIGSWVVGGPAITKAAIVAMVAAGFAGAARLTGPGAALPTRLAAGVLWAAGPFALTRIGVGHLNVVWAIAVLPWALPRLCRPSERPWSTFLAAGLLAFGGPASGTLGVTVVAVSLLVERDRRPVAVIAATGVANLVWIAPTAVLLWAGAEVNGAGSFVTRPGRPVGWLGLLVGNGFWRGDQQVGALGIGGALAGVAIAGLAVVGRSRLDRSWARPAVVVAVVGLALAIASALPGVRVAYDALTDLPMGAPLRESHRFLALWLLTAAPAAALGGEALARRLAGTDAPDPLSPTGVVGRGPGLPPPEPVVTPVPRSGVAGVCLAVPLAVAVAVAVPGWWGIGGRLDPVTFPHGWSIARSRIQDRPGTVVALPWSEYPPLSFAGGRQVFNPIPDYLGGDVVSSYDPRFVDEASQEQVDRRATTVDRLVGRARRGRHISDALARLGVRWVFLAHERGWDTYAGLVDDPGLRRVVARRDVELFMVRGWRGPVTTPSGRSVDHDRPVPFDIRTGAPKGSVVDVAGAPGWIQGWGTPVRVTADGRLELRGTEGSLWFWPAVALLVLDAALAGVVVVALRRRSGTAVRIAPPAQILVSTPPGR
jgi:hypothetical protein